MQRHKLTALLCALMVCALALPAGAEALSASPVTEQIAATQAIKAYTDENVAQADIDAILAAGAKAPSARNGQPWRFTVVRNAEALASLGATGGVMIVLSGQDGTGQGMNVDFDCGLAAGYMYLAAQSLGLGANIVMGPVSRAEAMRDTLGIPDGYHAVMAITLGHYDTDAVSAATPRGDIASIVNEVP